MPLHAERVRQRRFEACSYDVVPCPSIRVPEPFTIRGPCPHRKFSFISKDVRPEHIGLADCPKPHKESFVVIKLRCPRIIGSSKAHFISSLEHIPYLSPELPHIGVKTKDSKVCIGLP